MRSKQAIWGSLNFGLEDGMEYGWQVLGEHGNHSDTKEGPKAFVEKRAPNWAPASHPTGPHANPRYGSR
jgi:enoyl-CoA hydratase/carnithine racemase